MSFPDKPVAQLLGASGPIHAVTYSAGAGSYVLTGSSDRSIRLYNPLPTTGTAGSAGGKSAGTGFVTKTSGSPAAAAIPEGRLIQTYTEHGYEVLSLACAADNARFASAGGGRSVFLWDVSTAQTLRRFSGHAGRVNCVCFAGDGDSLVLSGGFDTTVRIWDTRSGGNSTSGGKPIQTLSEARDAISALVVRGPEILAASVDGRVRCYDARTGRLTTDVVSGSVGVTSLALTRDGRSLLVGALDSRLRLLDRDNGACLRTYAAPSAWRNEELRVQSLLGGRERFVVAGDEMDPQGANGGSSSGSSSGGSGLSLPPSPASINTAPSGRVWAWDLLTGNVVATVSVPWGPPGSTSNSRAVGRDGREKERRNVTSCLSWQDGGWGEQFCVGGTSGVVTVFGPR